MSFTVLDAYLILSLMSGMVLLKYTKLHGILRNIYSRCQKKYLGAAPINFMYRSGHTMQPSYAEKKFTVAVEGNIGCGKSSLLEYFSAFPVVTTFQEPVGKWTDIHGHNALKLLYEDPSRWSFLFNNYVMLSRLQIHNHHQLTPVKMMERSLHSTRQIFVENSFQSGMLTGLEYSVLQSWFENLLALPSTHIDLFVYLRVPPEICYQRIMKRNRKEEKTLSLDFLERLHDLHEKWLIHQKDTTVPVLVIDASTDLESVFQLLEKNKSEILCGCA